MSFTAGLGAIFILKWPSRLEHSARRHRMGTHQSHREPASACGLATLGEIVRAGEWRRIAEASGSHGRRISVTSLSLPGSENRHIVFILWGERKRLLQNGALLFLHYL